MFETNGGNFDVISRFLSSENFKEQELSIGKLLAIE